jgi:hypothetical protein
VRVQGDRVCLVQAVEQSTHGRSQASEAAVAGVDMHPEPVLARYRRDVGEGIHGARRHATGCGGHAERISPGLAVFLDLPDEIVNVHPEALVHRDAAYIAAPDSKECGSLCVE